jgi:hypothetical protein
MAAIVVAAVAAAGFALLLWAIGRAVTAVASRVDASGRSRQYLAGRADGVHVITVVACDDEFLVTLAAPAGGRLPGVFRVAAAQWPLGRVSRWQEEGTPLRAYLSQDGAVMLADPVLGGNAACEPPIMLTGHAREQARTQDQAPTEDK